MGAVGPAHICMIVNGGFSVHNKTTGALISEVELTQFFDSVRSSAFVFDPKIFYDQYSQRWFAVALDYNFGVPNTSFMLVATSASSDPTQAWFFWAIDADVDGVTQRDTWADYPGFGYDQDAVYLSGNMFSQTSGSFQYVKVWGLPKQQMIDGEAVLNWYEATNLPGFTWQPASHFGVGQGGFFVYRESNASLRVAQFVGLLGTPALLDWGSVTVANLPSPPKIPQSGSAITVDAGDGRVLNAAWRGDRLLVTRCVDVGGRAAVAWYDLDTSGPTLAVNQQGVVSDGTRSYSYPAIAINAHGDVGLGFSGGSSGEFMSAFFTSRLAGDPAGQMDAPLLLQAGQASYVALDGNGRNRWGDYSATVVDPTNDVEFWTFQEYAGAGNTWRTRIGRWEPQVGSTADHLAFLDQPSDTGVNATINAGGGVRVAVLDSLDRVVPGATPAVTLALGSDPSSGAATLGGTLTVNAVGGVATFADLTLDELGDGYTLTASATSLTDAVSDPFDIVPGAPAELVFSAQPTDTAAAAAINGGSGGIQVSVRDSFGNVVTGSSLPVTLAIGTDPSSGATLSGTLTRSAVNGVATFDDVGIDLVGVGYTLEASGGGLPTATSAGFDITLGPAAALRFVTEPTDTVAGSTINTGTGVQVAVQDAGGNLVTSASGQVTLALANDPVGGSTFGGTLSRNASAGIATFDDLSILEAGAGFTLRATSSGLTDAVSASFDILPGAAASLAFGQQPSDVTAGVAMAPAVTVTALDAHGNVATGYTGDVALALTAGSGPAGGTLSGTLTQTAAAGVASFGDLSLPLAGSGYTLTATAGGLGSAVSAGFAVTAAAVVADESTASVPAGVAGVATSVTIQARDAFGNARTTGGDSFSVDVSGANTASPTVTDNGDGSYTAAYTPQAAGSDSLAITLNGTAIGGSPYTSEVAPADTAPAASGVTVPGGVAGSVTCIDIQARDAFGNPATTGGDSFTVAVDGANTASPTVTDNGDGTYTATYTPTVAGDDLVAVQLDGDDVAGSPFTSTVAPAAASAADSTATVPAGQATQPTVVQVQARDRFGNPLVAGGATVAAEVTGANTATPAVTDNGDGSYSLQYTPTIVGTDQIAITLDGTALGGSPFESEVAAGAASAAQSTVDLPGGTAGEAMTLTVQAQDGAGNALAAGGDTVTATVQEPGGGPTAELAVTDAGDGTYTAQFTPTRSGAHAFSVSINGEPLAGSPFAGDVRAAAVAPEESTLQPGEGELSPEGEPIAAADGQSPANLVLVLRDRFGNPVPGVEPQDIELTADPATGVTVRGPSAATNAEGRAFVEVVSTRADRVEVAAQVQGQALAETVAIQFRSRLRASLPLGVRFFGLPLTPDLPQPEDIFGPDGWRLLRYDPATGQYVEHVPGAPGFAFAPGQGFWAQFTQDLQVNVLGEAPTGPQTLPLAQGWNAMANPFNLPLRWDLSAIRVLVDGADVGSLAETSTWSFVEPYAWSYNPTTQTYQFVYASGGVDTVERLVGLWIYAHRDGVALVLPEPTAASRASRQAVAPRDWTLQLNAAQGAGAGGSVFVGLSSGQARRLAARMPPSAAVAPAVELTIASETGRLAGEIRPWSSAAQSWELSLRSRAGGDVTLTWPSLLRSVPRGTLLELADLETGQVTLLNTRASLRVPATRAGAERRFRLTARVGHIERSEILSLATSATRGDGVQVDLVLSAPAEVTLTVRGLGGRVVRTIAQTSAAAGATRLTWDGTDDAGRPAPQGSYTVEAVAVSANGATTRAMRLVQVR